jgi:hypothetical protein
VLSTGDAQVADDAGGFASADNGAAPAIVGRGDTAQDATVLRVLSFTVPPGMTCLSFDFRFLSAEYPEYIDSDYNDAFIAELTPGDGPSTWTTSGAAIQGLGNNFAFDANGLPVTIKSTGPRSMSPAEAEGTPYGGATAPLRAQTPVVPGTVHTLYLSIFDQSDGILDTAVFIRNLAFSARTGAACGSGSLALGPAVAISSPASGSTVNTTTPTLTGTGGGAGPVTVRVYPGEQAVGAPLQELTATRSGAAWAVTTSLEPGEYTVQATQSGADGIHGVSAPATFTVAGTVPPPPPENVVLPLGQAQSQSQPPPAPPVPGKSVVARVASGTVLIKPRGSKRFVPFTGAANIPVGSVVDTTKGRITLTSAADTGGKKTQTADFYDGIFQIGQAVPKKKPKKPAALITDLLLKDQLSRASCAARSVDKKKGPKSVLGKLWGNGKGKFRTTGKFSSATVRGTIWLTQDECDGTLTKVSRGVVQVRDFKRKKTLNVKAGRSYLARARA